MNNIELYINNELCEIFNAEKLGIRLNRILIRPAELNTKDAQYSYSITIPASNINDRIFGYANVEEVKDKFNHDYNALLYVDSILVFDGKFRLSEIDGDGNYKGNLLIPAKKTIKELFGDTKMNALQVKWPLKFKEMVSSLNYWNKYKGTPDCIFPYVLYGLLPKVPDQKTGNYSDRDVWDETVRLGIEDFPPSINCIETIKKMFGTLKNKKGQSCKIEGTALDDSRLKNLYMSYSNPSDYVQEWNWGDLGSMRISGVWSMAEHLGFSNYQTYERQISLYEDEYGSYYTINLFNSNRAKFSIKDTGTNIRYNEYQDKYLDIPYIRKNLYLTIPRSGYYKVLLSCDEFKLNSEGEHLRFYDNGKKFTSTSQSHKDRNNRFDRSRYELQVLRDFGTGEFNNSNIVGFYNKPQFPQTSFDDRAQFPKYYPKAKGALVVDPSVNQNFVCGLHWGKHEDDYNPKDLDQKCNYMVIANGFSWNKFFSQEKKIFSAYSSWNKDLNGNYWCWGTKDEESIEDIEEDRPNPVWLDNPLKRRYGMFENYDDDTNFIEQERDLTGKGAVECIVWFEKGESIAVGAVGDMGDMRRGSNHHTEFDQWIVLIDNIKFNLEIEPFKVELEWNNFLTNGSYDPNLVLNWNDPSDFQKDEIDLVKFLPADTKADEWIDNFCKAFNLQLTQDDDGNFELNIKQPQVSTHIASVLDLDKKASIRKRSNQPLGLPAIFELGFKVNEEEQGYSMEFDKGGGTIETGSLDGSTVSQTSSFSYNWFTTINQKNKDGSLNQQVRVPIISNKEAWTGDSSTYKEMQKKSYTNYAQRFWYRTGDSFYDIGAVWQTERTEPSDDKAQNLFIPQLTDTISDGNPLILNYKNKSDTILRTYFNVIATNDSNYTDIECFLSPDEYEQLDGSKLVKLNEDLYYIAAIEGYDPLGRNKTKLRLIRKT